MITFPGYRLIDQLYWDAPGSKGRETAIFDRNLVLSEMLHHSRVRDKARPEFKLRANSSSPLKWTEILAP